MKVLSFHRMRNKKYKQLALDLQKVTPKKKQIVLNEYFSMCKMVYRVRSTEAYMIGLHPDQASQLEVVSSLYNEDSTFRKMISIVNNSVLNLFQGTDPDEPIMNAAADKPKLSIVP